ncbi:MAG: hypothetical protein ABEH77_10455 [Halobacteriaceae archaeon]
MTGEPLLTRKQKRLLELLLAFGLYVVVFDAAVGPVVDALLAGPQPSMFAPDPGPTTPFASEFPDTVRGWLALATLVPFIVAYIYYRPRLTGHSPIDYWKPVNPELVESRRE